MGPTQPCLLRLSVATRAGAPIPSRPCGETGTVSGTRWPDPRPRSPRPPDWRGVHGEALGQRGHGELHSCTHVPCLRSPFTAEPQPLGLLPAEKPPLSLRAPTGARRFTPHTAALWGRKPRPREARLADQPSQNSDGPQDKEAAEGKEQGATRLGTGLVSARQGTSPKDAAAGVRTEGRG